MNLADKIRHEVKMCNIYKDDDVGVALLKIFKEWLRDHEDCDPCSSSINKEIRRAEETRESS